MRLKNKKLKIQGTKIHRNQNFEVLLVNLYKKSGKNMTG